MGAQTKSPKKASDAVACAVQKAGEMYFVSQVCQLLSKRVHD
jgi:hypothetical protein